MLCLAQREVHTEVNAVTERRRGLRISQDRPIRVFESAANQFIAGETRDISATGPSASPWARAAMARFPTGSA